MKVNIFSYTAVLNCNYTKSELLIRKIELTEFSPTKVLHSGPILSQHGIHVTASPECSYKSNATGKKFKAIRLYRIIQFCAKELQDSIEE